MCDEDPWVCIGDMNKMTSQRKRGGSFLCFNNEMIHKSFRGMKKEINELEDCSCHW